MGNKERGGEGIEEGSKYDMSMYQFLTKNMFLVYWKNINKMLLK